MSVAFRGEGASTRRRRAPHSRSPPPSSSADSEYYYDDEPDHRSDRMYGGACSIGKFFLNPCLCLAMAARLCCRNVLRRKDAASTGPSRMHRLEKEECRIRRDALTLFTLTAFFVWAFHLALLRYDEPYRHIRPRTDRQLDRLPVVLKLFDFSTVDDTGGWMYPSQKFPAIHTLDKLHRYSKEPNYGGLNFSSLANASPSEFRRKINPVDFLVYREERTIQLKEMDRHKVSEKYVHDEDIEFSNRPCRRPNWKSGYYPNCNSFHEIDLSQPFNEERTSDIGEADYDSYLFNHGYYRDVWYVNTRSKDSLVLKVLRYKHKPDHRMMYTVQRDAMVMERLTSSPRIVDVYGHCSTSVYVEPVAYEVEEYIVPGSGYMKQKELNDSQDVDPQNDYTATEKLEMALEMAESIAELHGFQDGVIVHDDVQLCQWLRTREDKLKLGDFNRAEVMDWNEKKKEYCKYNNGEAYGNYRSPEEFAAKDLDEGIDVYSFGNNIYGLLTGLWVFYDTDDDGISQKNLIRGQLPFVDHRYRNRSYAESKLVEVMERCWTFDPANRIDIFEVVKLLRRAVEENTVKKETE